MVPMNVVAVAPDGVVGAELPPQPEWTSESASNSGKTLIVTYGLST
jgi:hypothetical protein